MDSFPESADCSIPRGTTLWHLREMGQRNSVQSKSHSAETGDVSSGLPKLASLLEPASAHSSAEMSYLECEKCKPTLRQLEVQRDEACSERNMLRSQLSDAQNRQKRLEKEVRSYSNALDKRTPYATKRYRF